MAEDLTANKPWTSFYARRDTLVKWHAHRCYDSSDANRQRPESGGWPNSQKSPSLPEIA